MFSHAMKYAKKLVKWLLFSSLYYSGVFNRIKTELTVFFQRFLSRKYIPIRYFYVIQVHISSKYMLIYGIETILMEDKRYFEDITTFA